MMDNRRAFLGVAVAASLAVMIAPIAGDAATGDRLILGQTNSANAVTVLRNTGSGTALRLSTANGSVPALAVSNTAKVANLNADELDGISSSGFERVASNSLALAPDASATTHDLLSVPGLGTLVTACSTTDALLFFAKSKAVTQVDASSMRVLTVSGTPTLTLSTSAITGDLYQFAPVAGVGSVGRYTIQFSSPGGGSRIYTATVTLTSQDSDVGIGKCVAWVQLS